MNSKRTICTLISLAACQFFSNAIKIFKERLRQQPVCIKLELSFRERGDKNLRLDNSNRQYTVASRYPSNGHFNNALSYKEFSSFIRLWIGNFVDSYVLHTRSVNHLFAPFDINDVREVAHDSDEELDLTTHG